MFSCAIYYVKVSNFVKLAKFDLLKYFCVLHYIKVTKFVKLPNLVFWKIFVYYTT